MGAEPAQLDHPGLERVFFIHKPYQGWLSFAAGLLIGQSLVKNPPSQCVLCHVSDD